MSQIPVLIVGAGPTGLTIASELYRHSIDFRIIDKEKKPVSTSNALAIQPRTLEIWDDMGIIDDALARGNVIQALNIHFDKKNIPIRLDLVDSAYPFVLALPQHDTEALLLEHLKSQNIEVETELELVDIYQSAKHVLVTLMNKHGKNEDVEAAWVIACDGAHSTIRKKLNMPFEGKELPQHFVMADCKLNSELPLNEVDIFFANDGPFFVVPFSAEYKRVIADITHDAVAKDNKTPQKKEMIDLIARRSNKNIHIDKIKWISDFWIHTRIVPKLRSGRVFFAGDAAHVHSPAGGQGMNIGIQDAYNLAWKLADIIKGKENPMVLDTYHEERYKIGEKIINRTTALTNFVTIHQPVLVTLRNIFLKLILKIKYVQKKLMLTLSQVNTNYRSSTLSYDAMAHLRGPKAGDRIKDSVISTSVSDRLSDYLRGTKYSLLVFLSIDEITLSNKNAQAILHDLKKKYADDITFICIATKHDILTWEDIRILDSEYILHLKYRVRKPCVYLVRPDKYIAYRSLVRDIDSLVDYCFKVFTR